MYDNPPSAVAFADGLKVPEHLLIEAINHFEDFYEEVYLELAKFGEVEELHVCDNIGDHMLGNIYAKYYNEEDTKEVFKVFSGRYYAGKPIKIEFSPVTDFREARCRLYKDGNCDSKHLIKI
jgi:splicing factor U2AF subunit